MLTILKKQWPIFAILVTGLLLRLPFHSKILFNWDSVNYALGIQGFNLANHRPHPPGNPLYIYLARFLTQFTRDENLSMVCISMAAGILSAVVLYWFAQHVFNKSDALFSALLLLTSPVAWLYDEVALTYSVEMMFSVAIAYSCYRALEGRLPYAYASAVLLALAGGFRPTSLLLFGPLLLFVLLKLPKKHAIYCALATLVLCSGWGILLIQEASGLATLLSATGIQSAMLDPTNTTTILHALFQAGHLCILLVGAYWLGMINFPARNTPTWERTFYNFWLLPGVLMILFYHMGQAGYLLYLLPAVFLVTPQLLRGLLEKLAPATPPEDARRTREVHQKMYVNMILFPVVGIIIFYLTSAPVIHMVDACWTQAQAEYGTVDSSKLIVLTRNSRYRDILGFRHAEYYLPNLHTYLFTVLYPPDLLFNPSGVRFLGWRFHAYQQSDNFQRGLEEDEKQQRLEFPDGIVGLLLADPEMGEYIKSGDPSTKGALSIEQHGCLLQVHLPEDAKELRVEEGQLVIY